MDSKKVKSRARMPTHKKSADRMPSPTRKKSAARMPSPKRMKTNANENKSLKSKGMKITNLNKNVLNLIWQKVQGHIGNECAFAQAFYPRDSSKYPKKIGMHIPSISVEECKGNPRLNTNCVRYKGNGRIISTYTPNDTIRTYRRFGELSNKNNRLVGQILPTGWV